MNVRATLVKCFRRLTPTQLKRLKWHEKEKTPICCGELSVRYFKDGAG